MLACSKNLAFDLGGRIRGKNMTIPILVTGAAGRVGAVGRTVTELLLKRGKAVRAMVRNEDERAQALRDMGAEVVVGDLLDLDSMHRVIAGCETMYFSMSISDAYLAATINAAAVAFRAGAELVRSAGRARAADSVSRRLFPGFDSGFGQAIKSDQIAVRRGQDFADRSGRRCAGGCRAARKPAVAHR